MKTILVFLFIGLFTFTSLGQPIYFESDIVIDTSTVDLVAQDFPDFDIDANGNLCIVWTEELEPYPIPSRYYITSILSSDGGESFYAKNFVENNPLPYPEFGSSRAFTKVAFDKNNNPMVGWREVSNYLIDGWVNFAKSSDGGLSYPPTHHTIHDRDATFDMAFSENNTFYLTWYDNDDNSIHLGISSDGGFTFDTVTTVVDLTAMGWSMDSSGPIELLINRQQDLSIFWNSFSPLRKRWLSKSTDGGNSFAAPDTFLNFPYRQLGSEVIIINGEYYLLFWGFIDQNNNHIYFSKSLNNGQSFIDPVLIDERANYDIHYNPAIGLLFRIGNTVYRSWDLGESFSDTAIVQADSGQHIAARKLLSDSEGNVYVLGQRINLNNTSKRHMVLNKTDQLVTINRSPSNRRNLSFILKQNYPNPFNPTTVIRYSLPVDRSTSLKIYDVFGCKIRTLVNERQQAGSYSVRWDGRNDAGEAVASGIYYYQVRQVGNMLTRKMILMK